MEPTVKMLALTFLLLIGMSLVAESLDQHTSKGYIYFAMGCSVVVEVLTYARAAAPNVRVHLRDGYLNATSEQAATPGA